ncbi:hypothetical protein DIPPA_70085 [Diplonema papillatum]|nr:hypothetical protein DIPPA_70085 [Diplonema papillatum]
MEPSLLLGFAPGFLHVEQAIGPRGFRFGRRPCDDQRRDENVGHPGGAFRRERPAEVSRPVSAAVRAVRLHVGDRGALQGRRLCGVQRDVALLGVTQLDARLVRIGGAAGTRIRVGLTVAEREVIELREPSFQLHQALGDAEFHRMEQRHELLVFDARGR